MFKASSVKVLPKGVTVILLSDLDRPRFRPQGGDIASLTAVDDTVRDGFAVRLCAGPATVLAITRSAQSINRFPCIIPGKFSDLFFIQPWGLLCKK